MTGIDIEQSRESLGPRPSPPQGLNTGLAALQPGHSSHNGIPDAKRCATASRQCGGESRGVSGPEVVHFDRGLGSNGRPVSLVSGAVALSPLLCPWGQLPEERAVYACTRSSRIRERQGPEQPHGPPFGGP